MEFVSHLECVVCGRAWPAKPTATTCPACGPNGILDVVFNYAGIARAWDREVAVRNGHGYGMWRFLPLLPVDPDGPRSTLVPGGTPLVNAPRLARALGIRHVWLKDEGRNPTASLKDRASGVGLAKALEAGASVVATASTGNAASSMAGAAAAAGIRSVVFVPRNAAQGKVAQLLIFGATVFQVEGTYADAFRLATQAIAEHGWYNRLSGINPYLVEGKKTAGLEIAMDLHWQPPDWVVVSVGDGCTVAGVARAFTDLQKLGWITRIPKILGVQADGAPAIYHCFHSGHYEPGPEQSIADGIAVGEPRNYRKAIRRVRESGGTFVLVSDEEILAAMRQMGRLTGVFAEPAAGAALAGLKKGITEGIVHPEETAVVLVSGSGLKDMQGAIAAAGAPHRVPPDMDRVDTILRKEGFAT